MTKLTVKKIFVYFLVIVLYFIFIHKLSWYTKEHVDKPKLPGRTEKQIATVGPGTTPTTTISQTLLLEGKYLELPFFNKWLLLKFCILIKKNFFCSILTKLDQIAVLMGLVKIGRNFFLFLCKILVGLLFCSLWNFWSLCVQVSTY